jgi:hypothetical protein
MIRELLLGSLAVLCVGLIPGVYLGTVLADELKALWRKAFPPDTGRHVTARPVTARHDATREPRTTLLGPAEVTGHADAMHEAAGPFLPPVPAWQPVERVHAEGDPFTGEMPVLDEAAERELLRLNFIRSQLPAPEKVTREDMERALAGLRALPAGGLSPDCASGCHAPLCSGRNCSCSCHSKAAPAYGQAPVADVLEAERVAGGLLT